MIGLSNNWSSLVIRLLMAAPLMLYGCLLIWQPCGPYAHHLYGRVCGLKVHQLYDELVILVLVSCPLIPSSYLWMMIGILIVCTSCDEVSDAIHIALNVFHVTCLIVATWGSFMGWSCEWGFLSFSALTSHLSLQKPLISHFGLLSSPCFWVLSFNFLVSSSLSFSPLMFDYTTVRLDFSLVSFFFSRLRVFLESLGGHCP